MLHSTMIQSGRTYLSLPRLRSAPTVPSFTRATHRHAPLLLRPRSHPRWVRYQSAQAVVRAQPVSHGQPHVREQVPLQSPPLATPTRPGAGLFAVEQVDGRARHLSWSASGSVGKEWRVLVVVDGDGQADAGTAGVPARQSVAGRAVSWLRQMFLPTNYPASVHRS